MPTISLSYFHDLISYDYPIHDSIIFDYLSILRHNDPSIHFLDTNFHHDFMNKEWDRAYKKYFLHEHSSRYTHKLSLNQHFKVPPLLYLYIYMDLTGQF